MLQPSTRPLLDGIRVLIADDDADSQVVFPTLLSYLGASVTRARSTAVALSWIAHVRPHVVLTDVRPPAIDGARLLWQVRRLSSPDGQRIPVIAVMAEPEGRDGRITGFAGHVTKPIDPVTLCEVVCRLVADVPSVAALRRRRLA